MEEKNQLEAMCKKPVKQHEAKTTRVDCDSASYFGGNAYIPVVLADAELQALVESEIKLPSQAREIKSIKRNVHITQCKAIPSVIPGRGFFPEVKVFVSGYVHKNIQYVDDYKGYVHDYAVNVPFSCNQSFRVFRSPEEQFSQKSTISNERIYLDKKGHGADHHVSGGASYEFYNEPIECKLLFSVVNDLDLHKDVDQYGRFHKIVEKAEVVLFFKLYQKQQTFLPLGGFGSPANQPTEGKVKDEKPDSKAQATKKEQDYESAKERIKAIVARIESLDE
ncbi:CsxC family protein [Amphibacillus jilinensis]|uniref:CsxC family protein n=1 Tax=Amphibacillus jilinensis TaxID=1216008 RepID=UPI00030E85A5|nr:hypothetical protein [Amphibacillus jilinensis]